MTLTLAVPASARSTNVQFHHISSGYSATTRLSFPLRRRRPIGTLNPAPDARWPLFVCPAASSSSPPPRQVDVGEAEARGVTMGWGKVSAVLFDMDGVLCDSEQPSRMAAVNVFAEMGVSVTVNDFVPFMGTGEANFLGGVASVKGVKGFDTEAAKKRFFEIYLDKYAKPNSGIGFPGALEIIMECKSKGLKVAVASSADRVKVDANLAAAGLPTALFDVIVSADAFENLKPAPDIFLAASKKLNVPPAECLVIEDALAGAQAAKAANMRCIAVTTTLSEERIQEASPSLVRKDIGNVSINDILNGGSSASSNQKSQNYQNSGSLGPYAEQLPEKELNGFVQGSGEAHIIGRFQGSRRDILRYGSLGIAISCLLFALSNWKAMQYASLKGVLNLFSWGNKQVFGQNRGEPRSSRIQHLKNYLSNLESRGTASTMPEFPSKLDWLNTAPLQFSRNLKGRVILLDFWTYCCINCMHVLPDLEFLERKYSDKPFTVIGVHSAKFNNEKDLEAIRNAVLRYNITHPVVNDGDMYLWRELGVNSWPTFIVVGPTGKILGQLAGEGHRQDLDDLVDAALQFYKENNLLGASPIPLALEKDKDLLLLESPLKFPGKLAIDVLNNRIFISDSNHNRIVVTDRDGNFIIQVGSSGEEGLHDGSFDDACFNRPQGLAYNPNKNTLYVADTENHALRPSSARVLVEMDITSHHADEIWIGDNHNSYWQAVVIEHKPRYCFHCKMFGHLRKSKQTEKQSNPIQHEEETTAPLHQGNHDCINQGNIAPLHDYLDVRDNRDERNENNEVINDSVIGSEEISIRANEEPALHTLQQAVNKSTDEANQFVAVNDNLPNQFVGTELQDDVLEQIGRTSDQQDDEEEEDLKNLEEKIDEEVLRRIELELEGDWTVQKRKKRSNKGKRELKHLENSQVGILATLDDRTLTRAARRGQLFIND